MQAESRKREPNTKMEGVVMEKKTFQPTRGPKSDSHYSPAVIYGSLIFVSGQGPLDAKTGQIVKGDIEEQTEITLNNLKALLEEAGSSLNQVLKTTVYLSDIVDFERLNEVYKTYFPNDPPARTCVQAGKLFGGITIEIDAVAHL